jgi:hypothetical protein
MKITRKSQLSGKTNTMELDATNEQLVRHERGELAQNVFTNISSDEREFIISGITPEEWVNAFSHEEA